MTEEQATKPAETDLERVRQRCLDCMHHARHKFEQSTALAAKLRVWHTLMQTEPPQFGSTEAKDNLELERRVVEQLRVHETLATYQSTRMDVCEFMLSVIDRVPPSLMDEVPSLPGFGFRSWSTSLSRARGREWRAKQNLAYYDSRLESARLELESARWDLEAGEARERALRESEESHPEPPA